jgi:hypothetical protein
MGMSIPNGNSSIPPSLGQGSSGPLVSNSEKIAAGTQTGAAQDAKQGKTTQEEQADTSNIAKWEKDTINGHDVWYRELGDTDPNIKYQLTNADPHSGQTGSTKTQFKDGSYQYDILNPQNGKSYHLSEVSKDGPIVVKIGGKEVSAQRGEKDKELIRFQDEKKNEIVFNRTNLHTEVFEHQVKHRSQPLPDSNPAGGTQEQAQNTPHSSGQAAEPQQGAPHIGAEAPNFWQIPNAKYGFGAPPPQGPPPGGPPPGNNYSAGFQPGSSGFQPGNMSPQELSSWRNYIGALNWGAAARGTGPVYPTPDNLSSDQIRGFQRAGMLPPYLPGTPQFAAWQAQQQQMMGGRPMGAPGFVPWQQQPQQPGQAQPGQQPQKQGILGKIGGWVQRHPFLTMGMAGLAGAALPMMMMGPFGMMGMMGLGSMGMMAPMMMMGMGGGMGMMGGYGLGMMSQTMMGLPYLGMAGGILGGGNLFGALSMGGMMI